MTIPLSVLILEDWPADLELILQELRRAGYAPKWRCAVTKHDYLTCLGPGFDLILADDNQSQFTIGRALELMKANGLDIPFIIITDRIDPGLPAECLRMGVADYCRKDRLERLGLAVARVLREKELEQRGLKAREDFKKAEYRFRTLFHHSLDVMIIVDAESGRILAANQTIGRILGYECRALEGKHFSVLFPPDSRQSKTEFLETSRVHDAVFESQTFLHSNGSVFPMDMTTSLIPWDGSRAILFTLRDVSEHDLTQSARWESESRFKSLSENASDIIYTLDTKGRITYVNPAWERILGYRRESVMGRHFADFTRKQDRDNYARTFNRVNGIKETVKDATAALVHRNGSIRFFKISCAPNINASGQVTGVVGLCQDITEAQELEAHLQQAHKMEAIGTLAGGITHDFNNILAAILGYTEQAILEVPEENNAHKKLLEVRKAAFRAKDLVKQILTFSRQSKQKFVPVEIAIIAREALRMLRASLPATVEIRQDIRKNSGTVNADPTQIQQILMNLCTNAAHAMQKKGGVLGVSVESVTVEHSKNEDGPGTETRLDILPGSYVKLTVTDTGEGIPPEIRDRIFDPYFTTKQKGQGTGLGLSVVHGIVKSHGGTITVHSRPGEGSAFHVYLPRLDHPGESAASRDGEPLLTGTETILFVDDEQALVDMGKEILEHLGYRVVTRTGSIDALELFRTDPRRFDLVITDMTMPNMTGDNLAREIMRIRPRIPVVLCTGFSEMVTEENVRDMGIRRLLMKPLVMRDLAGCIREILDGRGRATRSPEE